MSGHAWTVDVRRPNEANCDRCGLVAWVVFARPKRGTRLSTQIYVLDERGRKARPSAVKCEDDSVRRARRESE